MDVVSRRNVLRTLLASACILQLNSVYAVDYNYPTAGSGTLAVAPQVLSADGGDTLNINSGTFATTSSTNYTVTHTAATAVSTTSINVAAGATLSYSGTDSTARTINSNQTVGGVAFIENITNSGTIDSGTGLFAIYNSSTNTGATNTVNITNSGIINGGVFVYGPATINLTMLGNAQINGGLTLTPKAIGGVSNLFVGDGTIATNYTSGGTIQDISLVTVRNNATFTLNDSSSPIIAMTVNTGGIVNLNSSMGGATTSDGNITNAGTINVSANITKTGGFTTTGTTSFLQAVTVSTSGYTNNNIHATLMTDNSNYGNVTFTSATPTFTNFNIQYGGGYLSGGTYTLVTSPNAIVSNPTYSMPAPNLFLAWGTPFKANANKQIQVLISRTPFQTYATTPLTAQIGGALEQIGSNNPSDDMLTVLNAVERSTTAGQVESSLRQLAPLISAPLYGFIVQDQMMDQVELRIASIRPKTYMAGDLASQNALWLRPFGDSANQQPKQDSFGYYATTGGLAFGFDRYVDTGMILGVAGSYSLSHVIDKINANSNTQVKCYQVMLYGSNDLSYSKYINWIIAAAANNYHGQRYMSINGLNLLANSKYSSQLFGIKSTLGKSIPLFGFLQANPEATAQYTYAKQYQYSETDAMGANLQVNRDNSNVVMLGAGGKLSTPIELHPGICVPEISVMGLYNVVNGKQDTISTFLSGGSQFVANMSLPRSGVQLGASVTFAVLDSVEIKIDYQHLVMDRFTDNAFYLNFKYIL